MQSPRLSLYPPHDAVCYDAVMRYLARISLAAAMGLIWNLSQAGEWPQGGADTGSIEFVARATPTGGRAESVMRLPFYLLRKSYAEIKKEAQESEPPPVVDEFVDRLELSKELKAWMKRTKLVQLSGSEFMKQIKPDDIFEVPEFYEAYLARNAGDVKVGFPSPKFKEGDREKNPEKFDAQVKEYQKQLRKFLQTHPDSTDGMDLHLAELDPGQHWLRRQAERQGRIRHRTAELSEVQYLAAKTETNLDGRASLAGVPAGQYWLSTLDGDARIGDVRLRWDLPVTVRPGRVTSLELNNINAVQPERSAR